MTISEQQKQIRCLKWLSQNKEKWKQVNGKIVLKVKEEEIPEEILNWIRVYNNAE
jgi:hypothetical protein